MESSIFDSLGTWAMVLIAAGSLVAVGVGGALAVVAALRLIELLVVAARERVHSASASLVRSLRSHRAVKQGQATRAVPSVLWRIFGGAERHAELEFERIVEAVEGSAEAREDER